MNYKLREWAGFTIFALVIIAVVGGLVCHAGYGQNKRVAEREQLKRDVANAGVT